MLSMQSRVPVYLAEIEGKLAVRLGLDGTKIGNGGR